ncbi:hypothetical protein HOC35_03745 [Candidatus Woesearchaeota archaeon]|jgi:hypothetical protein|nr:hypothetical protein [Candidatus Woesearchaeota archaeon]
MLGYSDIRDMGIVSLLSLFLLGAAPSPRIETDQRLLEAMQDEISIVVEESFQRFEDQDINKQIKSKIITTVELMPAVYQNIATNSFFFVSNGGDDLSGLCDWKTESVCYEAGNFFVYAEKIDTINKDLAYVLADIYYSSIPRKQKINLERKLKTYLHSDKEPKDFDAWKGNSKGPGFWLLYPEATNSVEELVISYVTDVYGNDGNDTVYLLKGGYKGNVIRIFDHMEKFGFLGTEDEALKTRADLEYRGNVG